MVTAVAEQSELVGRLKALADPNRLRILEMLRERGCCTLDVAQGMCACDIEARLDLSQPTISHHMKILKEAGLVETQKIGQWMWYRRNEGAIRETAKALQNGL